MGHGSQLALDFGLTGRQWKLINEYMIDFNGKRAAVRAGYPEKSASQQASMELRKVNVKQALRALMDQRSEEWGLDHGRILQEMQAIAFANMKDFASWDDDGVSFIDSDDIEDARAAAIVEVNKTVDKNGTERMKVKFGSKEQMLITLAKISGLMREKPIEENRGAFAKWADEMRAEEEEAEEQREREETSDDGAEE